MVNARKVQIMKKQIDSSITPGFFTYMGQQLKLHNNILRVDTLPTDGGKMLHDITEMADRPDIPFKKVILAKWAIMKNNKGRQLQKAFELGYIPDAMITGQIGSISHISLDSLRNVVLHHPSSNTLSYIGSGATALQERNQRLQQKVLATI